jgi:N6-adenosine-specific RNA methylase IME4
LVKCEEFYEKFRQLQKMASEIKGYCQVDARESIWRFKKYNEFCEKHLLPIGNIPESALRPLIAERNSDIAPIVVERIKTRLKSKSPKDSQITNRVVRKYIADMRRKAVETPPFPKNKYRCLVIDPPWPVQKIDREERPNQHVEFSAQNYSTMTLEHIENLPITELADQDGCHVYLWVTHRFLPQGLKLFEKWGVKYQCLLTWVKKTGMTPFSWMYNTEHVLFGRVGSLALLQLGMKLSFEGSVFQHSEKPEQFYDILRVVSPPPRLDMFARRKREGFDVWGNEVNNDISDRPLTRVKV